MKSKTLYTILGIFAILIIIYFIQASISDKKPIDEAFTDLSQGLEEDNIGEILVYRPGEEDNGVHLVHEGKDWTVASNYGALAKERNITEFMEKLTALSGELRGTSEEIAAEFGLTDTSMAKMVIKDKSGNVIRSFELGKDSPDYRGSYVRVEGDPKIYRTMDGINRYFGLFNADSDPDSDRWSDKKIIHFTKDELQKIKVISGNKYYELVKETTAPQVVPSDTSKPAPPPQEKWVVGKTSRGADIDEKQITSMLSRITNLQATDLVDPDSAEFYGFNRSKYKVELYDEVGDKYIFELGNKITDDTNRDKYYARLKSSKLVYLVAESGYNNIFVTPFEKKS
ncbi:MAG: DUF4340 domain-containing protein [candidate division Zixibacteria bacterium]|nr:DUF4340 domain-containing protein [candidate division Zixibacteria bacterium]